ncbi:MAG: hypothetical protein QOC64_3513 [Solirubrobacteraceae bacterium]|nr:hypothetical protein [Solirubrobacteraceae bacterium]
MDENSRPDLPRGRPPQGRTGAQIPLVQAAMRRRRAERAFEDYAREMARRWGPSNGDELAGPGTPLPRG